MPRITCAQRAASSSKREFGQGTRISRWIRVLLSEVVFYSTRWCSQRSRQRRKSHHQLTWTMRTTPVNLGWNSDDMNVQVDAYGSFNTKARSPENFMDVSVWFGRRALFVPQHDDQIKEQRHEGTSQNQSDGQGVCVSAIHPDIGSRCTTSM